MKEIKVERKVYDTKYEANDGEIFSDREECLKYENSALTVLTQKYKKLVVCKTDELSLTGLGNDDVCIELVKVNRVADCDTIKQMYIMINRLTKKDLVDYQREQLDMIDKALNTSDILIIGRGCEYDDVFYVAGTTRDFVDKILVKFAKFEGGELDGGGC